MVIFSSEKWNKLVEVFLIGLVNIERTDFFKEKRTITKTLLGKKMLPEKHSKKNKPN